MNKTSVTRRIAAIIALAVTVPAAFGQVINPSFELGTGDDATGWNRFNNAFVQGANARTGTRSAKMFGNFSGSFNVSGIYQDIAYTPSLGMTASVWGYNPSNDAVNPSNTALLKLIYRNAADVDLLSSEVNLNTSAAAQDSWQLLTATLGAAPVGTTKVSVFLLYLQPEFGGGAAFFDDVSLTATPVPEPMTMAALGLGFAAVIRRRRR